MKDETKERQNKIIKSAQERKIVLLEIVEKSEENYDDALLVIILTDFLKIIITQDLEEPINEVVKKSCAAFIDILTPEKQGA